MKILYKKSKSLFSLKLFVLAFVFAGFAAFIPFSLSLDYSAVSFVNIKDSIQGSSNDIFSFELNEAYAQATPAAAEANKDYTPSTVGRFVSDAIGKLVLLIVRAEGWIITKLAYILMALMRYNGFVTSAAVSKGWTLVRDVSNMFFALIILAIALGTILKVESYNIKRLLPKVLLMAILVNFSRTICGLMIDFAQVIMITFAAAFAGSGGSGGSNIVSIFKLQDLLFSQTEAEAITNKDGIKADNVIITGILIVVMLAIAVVVLLVMTVVILMRMIMLWILLVLSPLPFILSAFPQGEKYAQQFWQEFSKYVIVGPIMAFFLWLSFAVADPASNYDKGLMNDASESVNASTSGDLSTDNSVVFTSIGNIESFLSFVIGIGMLMASLMVTQQLGVAGGSFAGAASAKIKQTGIGALRFGANTVKFGAKLPFKGANLAEKTLFGSTGIGLNPMRAYRGFKERYASWSERMESEGANKGSQKAKNLILKEGKRNIATRAFGYAGLAMTSPKDFSQNYLGWRGIKRGFGTIFKGTSIDEMKDWEKERTRRKEEIALRQKLGFIGDVTEAGEKQIVSDGAENLTQLLKSSNAATVSGALHLTVDYDDATKFNTVADVFDSMNEKTLGDLRDYLPEGTDIELKRDSTGKALGGLDDETTSKQKDALLSAIAKQQSEKLMKEHNEWFDNNTVASSVLVDSGFKTTKGKQYYAEEETKRSSELSRVKAGGLSNIQAEGRQKRLEDIQLQIVSILKKIDKDGDSRGEYRAKIDELVKEGTDLGGVAVEDDKIKTRLGISGVFHFGKSNTDRSSQNIIPVITRSAVLTKEEKEENTKKDDANGLSILDKLDRDLAYFRKERSFAEADPNTRRILQKNINSSVEKDSKKLIVEDQKKMSEFKMAPIPYEALTQARAAERDQLSKLPQAMEWTEIESELRTAIQMGNKSRVRALMMKAANDYNDNEIWNAWGYGANAKGMRDFGQEVLVNKLKMNEQEMLSFMNDIAYVNEDRNHFETARMVTMHGGQARWSTEEEHAASISNENLKQASRGFLQNTNRLGFGGEKDGKYEIALSGKLTLAGLGDVELQNRINRGEFNPSLLSKIASDLTGLEDMVKRGWISRRTMEMIVSRAATKKIQAEYTDLLRKAKQKF